MTILYLVRHAVTPHTGTRLTGHAPGVSLSADGRAQAEAVAGRLASARVDAIYSSPLERTAETADAIARACRLPVSPLDAIAEVEYGRWTDRSLRSLMRTKLWSRVRTWPSAVRFPDGETLQEVQARAVAGVEDLRIRHPKDRICLVSHGDVIKLLVAHYIGLHIDLFQRIVIAPASLSVIVVGDDGPRVVALNLVGDVGDKEGVGAGG